MTHYHLLNNRGGVVGEVELDEGLEGQQVEGYTLKLVKPKYCSLCGKPLQSNRSVHPHCYARVLD